MTRQASLLLVRLIRLAAFKRAVSRNHKGLLARAVDSMG
jgi:hypothetical protein